MSEVWRADLARVLSWTQADDKALERLGARLSEERRALLRAIVETRGDRRALVERLGPMRLAKLRAHVRIPDRVREPASSAWRAVEAPLSATWSPPEEASAEALAAAFLERFGARLEAITGDVTKAAAAARSLAGTLRTFSGAKELVEAVTTLEAAVGELRAAATTCTHPDGDRASWASHAQSLTHEAVDTLEAVSSLRATPKELSQQFDALARALSEWSDAPPATRAAQAQSMATRVRAAADAAAGMHQELLNAVLH